MASMTKEQKVLYKELKETDFGPKAEILHKDLLAARDMIRSTVTNQSEVGVMALYINNAITQLEKDLLDYYRFGYLYPQIDIAGRGKDTTINFSFYTNEEKPQHALLFGPCDSVDPASLPKPTLEPVELLSPDVFPYGKVTESLPLEPLFSLFEMLQHDKWKAWEPVEDEGFVIIPLWRPEATSIVLIKLFDDGIRAALRFGEQHSETDEDE